MSLAIKIAGSDITTDVVIKDAEFTMATGPNPGDFTLRVKDPQKTYAFTAGQRITVDFNGVRCYDGYVLQATHSYAFYVVDTTDPGSVVKMWTLRGYDVNILFERRVIFNQSNPDSPLSLDFGAGTSDLTYLDAIMSHLTVGDDDLITDFHHVATPNPDKAGIGLTLGDKWSDVMQFLNTIPGAVWGIRPSSTTTFNVGAFDSAFAQSTTAGRVVYWEDTEVETAPFAISDVPDDVNSFGYSGFEWTEDASRMVNDAQVWGVGLGQDRLTYAHVTDAASIAEHGRWENGNGWRFNLYKQSSVNAYTNSLIYGSPANLHGPKDPSIVVRCRVRQPGLMPGHKVRIISEVYGENIVLPIRRFKMTFVDLDSALFDLEMTWDIDKPRNFFDYPPLPAFNDTPDDITTSKPDTCTDLEPSTWWGIGGGGGWEIQASHPAMGWAAAIDAGASFRPRRRYWQFNIGELVGSPGDGYDRTRPFVYFRRQLPATPHGLRLSFNVPAYNNFVGGIHLPPMMGQGYFIPRGTQSNDLYAAVAISIEWNGRYIRLVTVGGGVARVNGIGIVNSPGATYTAEIGVYGSGTGGYVYQNVRPVNQNLGSTIAGDPNPGTGAMAQDVPYSPAGSPWSTGSHDSPTYERNNYLYVYFDAFGGQSLEGGVPGDAFTGNPDTAPVVPTKTPHSLYDFLYDQNYPQNTDLFAYNTGVHDAWTSSLTVNSIQLVPVTATVLPGDYILQDCTTVDVTPQPETNSRYCERATRISDGVYATTFVFAGDTTEVSIEGMAQRQHYEYVETDNQHFQFLKTGLVDEDTIVWVCYRVVA